MNTLNREKLSEILCGRAQIFVYSEIDSTNSEAKRYASGGGECPAVFVAESQSAGRGRMGRSFYSPEGTGLYFSVLFKDLGNAQDTLMITTAASVAVRRAIFSVCGIDTGIKWVNDLYLNGKKVSGILAEAVNVGDERWTVVGVGINLTTKDFPSEIENIATSLDVKVDINRLAGECALGLLDLWGDLYNEEIIKEYREASIVIGREIKYISGDGTRVGIALDVDSRGRLIVKSENGEIVTLNSGEISIRFS